jgi:hypothetical protein
LRSSRSFRTERRRTASASIGNRYPAFPQESIAGEVTGSTRVSQGLIEICSLSRGYGRTSDSLLGLVQDTSDEFELTVDVEGLEGFGEAGVEARVFGGTGSDPSQAVVRISLQSDAVGIGFVLSSGVRSRTSASMDSTVAAPVPVQLPVRIGIERSGNEITTFFSFGESFIRCDCNGDGEVDVSDMVSMLGRLFLGGPPCVCDESGDCNNDDENSAWCGNF